VGEGELAVGFYWGGRGWVWGGRGECGVCICVWGGVGKREVEDAVGCY